MLSDHQPSGAISQAGMVSPEAEIHSHPKMIALVNGLMALSKYGLDRCFGGFGHTSNWDSECENRMVGNFNNMSGYLKYLPQKVETIVDELATLMTSGRLNARSRALIQAQIQNESTLLNATVKAQQLIATTSEFHATGTINPTSQQREAAVDPLPSYQPYKALVVVMLHGGYDSYNVLVPKTCSGTNSAGQTVVEQYNHERGTIQVPIEKRDTVVNSTGTGQPCEEFAIHRNISVVRDLYNQGDLCFFMNTGLLNQPVTRQNFEALTISQLFAHNAMQLELQKVDPYDTIVHSGFLGRLAYILNHPSYDFTAQALGINSLWRAVTDNVTLNPPPIVMSEFGAQRFNSKPQQEAYEPRLEVQALNNVTHMASSIFGETWSDHFTDAIEESDFFADALANVSLPLKCPSRRMDMVLQLMETRYERGVDRDMFFLGFGSWDHHIDLEQRLEIQLTALNTSIACYVNTLKEMELWNNVTLVVMSDFGRTLTPNSNRGSDRTLCV